MADEIFTEFKLQYFDSRVGRLAIITMDNGADHTKPNVFGEKALNSLTETLDELESQDDVKGLLLTGKHFIFAVGADLTEFEGKTEEFARESGEQGHRAFRRIMDLPYPTLAAINGACMGGGLEIALHCDYRTIKATAGPIAFPEVFLSIFPAWGGTQLAPRVVGAKQALEVIVTNALNNNKMMKAPEAFERGFADRMYDPAEFLEKSRELLEAIVAGEESIDRDAQLDEDALDEALKNARDFADNKVHGATRAPYIAIDLIEFAARGGDLDEGYEKEEDGLAELLPSRQAQAAVYAFQLTQQRIKKQPWRPDVEPRKVRKMGVVGSGLMGAQIGALFLKKYEVPLVMKDIDQGVLDNAKQHIEDDLDKQVQKGRLGEGKAQFLKSLVTYTLDYEPLEGADFVIEAVLERMDLKKQIFADLEDVLDEGAVFATNTSSLSVEEMASDLEHPERVVGFHFFNPISVMPFLEIVRPASASDEAIATAFEVSKTIRKSAVQCADTPAFIVNRMLSRFNGAGIEAVRRGNSFRDVDDAIKGLGLPMGPFELFGFVGIKVAFHTAETLHEAFPDRFPLDDNFKRIAELDVDGIYDWSSGGAPHDEILDVVEVDEDAEKLSAEEIQRAALEAAADEARIMIDEGVVADARDIDTGMLLGAGFPFFMGGVCKYCDQVGISEELFGAPLVTETDHAFD
ncbi:MAG: 3-hydroxyacyl-CoA dehydrogenase NAD-binding domain-containing protein [Nitriliruptorales bacterium]|nr:3-hydroxyacyl-CoA dehydrogenase NAD-binding domain-containing protein [Nitriliruptorales bacterium]